MRLLLIKARGNESERISAGLAIKAYMHRVCADLLMPMAMVAAGMPLHTELAKLYRTAEKIVNTFAIDGKVKGIEASNMLAWMPVQMFMLNLDTFERALGQGTWEEFVRVKVLPQIRKQLVELRDGLGLAVTSSG